VGEDILALVSINYFEAMRTRDLNKGSLSPDETPKKEGPA